MQRRATFWTSSLCVSSKEDYWLKMTLPGEYDVDGCTSSHILKVYSMQSHLIFSGWLLLWFVLIPILTVWKKKIGKYSRSPINRGKVFVVWLLVKNKLTIRWHFLVRHTFAIPRYRLDQLDSPTHVYPLHSDTHRISGNQFHERISDEQPSDLYHRSLLRYALDSWSCHRLWRLIFTS